MTLVNDWSVLPVVGGLVAVDLGQGALMTLLLVSLLCLFVMSKQVENPVITAEFKQAEFAQEFDLDNVNFISNAELEERFLNTAAVVLAVGMTSRVRHVESSLLGQTSSLTSDSRLAPPCFSRPRLANRRSAAISKPLPRSLLDSRNSELATSLNFLVEIVPLDSLTCASSAQSLVPITLAPRCAVNGHKKPSAALCRNQTRLNSAADT
ncbi:hypothetical protein [Bythopirellula goksoeyrii]|nr:hypothetical protein [Bythopirellula goksoeyrii]